MADKPGKRENGAAHQRWADASSESAAEPIGEGGGYPVDEYPIPVQRLERDVAAAQRHGEENPVKRIDHPGLYLADQGLAAYLVGIPQRHAAGVEFSCLVVEPGQH